MVPGYSSSSSSSSSSSGHSSTTYSTSYSSSSSSSSSSGYSSSLSWSSLLGSLPGPSRWSTTSLSSGTYSSRSISAVQELYTTSVITTSSSSSSSWSSHSSSFSSSRSSSSSSSNSSSSSGGGWGFESCGLPSMGAPCGCKTVTTLSWSGGGPLPSTNPQGFDFGNGEVGSGSSGVVLSC